MHVVAVLRVRYSAPEVWIERLKELASQNLNDNLQREVPTVQELTRLSPRYMIKGSCSKAASPVWWMMGTSAAYFLHR